MTEVECRRAGIQGFPSLIAYNFNPKKLGENERIVGTHTVNEVKKFVVKMQTDGAKNASRFEEEKKAEEEKKNRPGEEKPIEIWEESTAPADQDTRMHDAASAFIFGLKQGIFTGREELEDLHLDALKEWLRTVSETFPGRFNRQMISELYDHVRTIQYLAYDHWDRIVSDWQNATVVRHKAQNLKHLDKLPKWQKNAELFLGDGSNYEGCKLYTCGQWTLFHMMTINPMGNGMRSPELMVSVVASIRRFMKYFFGCIQCRTHFLEHNTNEKVREVFRAKNQSRYLKIWLWRMHNSVNARIGHPLWPKPEACSDCGNATRWKEANVLRWLVRTYGYNEIDVENSWWPSLRKHETPKPIEHDFTKPKYVESNSNGTTMFYFMTLTFLAIYYFYIKPRYRPGLAKDNK